MICITWLMDCHIISCCTYYHKHTCTCNGSWIWKTNLNCQLMNSRPISSTWNGRRAFTMGCDARSTGVHRSTTTTSAPSLVRRKDGRPPQTPVVGLPERGAMGGDACSPRCPAGDAGSRSDVGDASMRNHGVLARRGRSRRRRGRGLGHGGSGAQVTDGGGVSRRTESHGLGHGWWRGLKSRRKNVAETHNGDWVAEKEGDCESIRQGVSKW